ncbi:Not1 N-terminal domain, CCR4-Not complex component-domain-containing protein [Mycena albidolilacea]|uniref:General negative regulator of transcription subunit n=1 Tax=Mycena albidolilacea TaxID=1033008 RepID=A0AAD7ATR5_9AGAR|nr:Not1 N-terminal domain, CCR4-Not complex component-domain-containing protein [Mycena albidolilacea]
MAARKLQTEIDRTLKKISEGVELFESIYDKMQASTNQAQKEKLELELKSQIKKLQRLRDQIKTWLASNDIKDKSQLLDNRKLIETQMEKFKACEKEMKTKAFSKEGLIQAAKLDPKEQEKEEATLWLQTQVEELQMQVEQSEAEIETLAGTGKKKNKSGSAAGRLEELEHLNERRKWHISRLEIVLRLLNNGSLPTDKVLSLKDDVQYFVESNTDEGFDEDEGIYDDLNLDEEEEKFGLAPEDDDSDGSDIGSEDPPPRSSSKKHDEESVTSSKQADSPILKKAVPMQVRKASVDATSKPPAPNFVQQPMASILKAGLPPPIPRNTTVRYSVAAAGGSNAAATQPVHGTPPQPPSHAAPPASASVSPPNPALVQPTAPSIPPPSSTPQSTSLDQSSGVPSSPSLTHPSTTSPMLSSSASVSHHPDGSFYSGQDSPALSEGVPSSLGGPAATSSPPRALATRKDSISSPPRAGSQSPSVSQLLDPSPPLLNGNSPGQQPQPAQVPQQPVPQFPPGVKVPQSEQAGMSILSAPQQPSIGAQRPPSQPQPPQRPTSNVHGSLADLVSSFESVKQKAPLRMTNLDQVHKILEGGYSNIPQPQDTEKPKYYVPRNPFPTAPYYPQAPNPLLSTAAIYPQLDVETLFYVFYFLPGTYQQYLAAKELKRQSWRFHIKYLTWFQRHSEPQAITEEYEQGVYVYFDWEGSWCQRKKADFRFEYRYLSDD